MNKKENSGYKKTHQRIQDSLLTLMGQKKFQNITVNDVCTLAGINRSTFYAHFQDMYAVMETIEQNLEEELADDFSSYYNTDTVTPSDYLIPVIRHIYRHRTFFQVYLSDSASILLANSMVTLQTQIVKPLYEKLNVPDRYGVYYFEFFKSGLITVLRRWLDDGCPESPEELSGILLSGIPALPPELLHFD